MQLVGVLRTYKVLSPKLQNSAQPSIAGVYPHTALLESLPPATARFLLDPHLFYQFLPLNTSTTHQRLGKELKRKRKKKRGKTGK